MESIDRLERGIDALTARLRVLEEENGALKQQVAELERSRNEVLERIDALLTRVQQEMSP